MKYLKQKTLLLKDSISDVRTDFRIELAFTFITYEDMLKLYVKFSQSVFMLKKNFHDSQKIGLCLPKIIDACRFEKKGIK